MVILVEAVGPIRYQIELRYDITAKQYYLVPLASTCCGSEKKIVKDHISCDCGRSHHSLVPFKRDRWYIDRGTTTNTQIQDWLEYWLMTDDVTVEIKW